MEKVRKILASIPWDDVHATFDALVDAGESPGKAAAQTAHLVDEQLDFRAIVGGPAGEVLEALDYAVVRAGVRLGIRAALAHKGA